jgi:2-dehydropantoate 2-reductase
MRILILGAGAVGGYYGARLIQVGADVTFLVRPEKQRLLKKNGLVIERSDETVKLNPATVTKDSLNGDVDLVVLTPKSYDFAEAIEVVKVIQGKPFLLPFLNGIDHLHQMDRLFGKERVMAGAAYVSTTLTADGSVQQLRDDPSFLFGARHESQKNIAANLHKLCSTSAFESILSLQINRHFGTNGRCLQH